MEDDKHPPGANEESARSECEAQSIAQEHEESKASEPRHTAIVSRVLTKSGQLASSLNHPNVAVEHFIIAMSLVKETNEEFSSRNLNGTEARKAALAGLIEREPVPQEPTVSGL